MHYKNNEISIINKYLNDNKKSFNIEIGELIKQEKELRKIKSSILAERSAMSPLYLSQIESGKYNISLLKFLTICNALEIYPNKLLESFLIGCKKDDDELYYLSQKSKNISKNIIDYMKRNTDYKN